MKNLYLIAAILMVLTTISCKKDEIKSSGTTSPQSNTAAIIDGVVIDEAIPAYRIVEMTDENTFGLVNLMHNQDTTKVKITSSTRQNADIFEGNIVRANMAKGSNGVQNLSFVENYDLTFTTFLKTIGGHWTSISNDTITLRKNGKVKSNIKDKMYDEWNIVEQPALNGINRIVLKRTKGVAKEEVDTVFINMERQYLNFPGEDELSLKYQGN